MYHENEKQFKCDHCDTAFYTGWRLNQHVKSHSDINQKFVLNMKHHLTVHIREGVKMLFANFDTTII